MTAWKVDYNPILRCHVAQRSWKNEGRCTKEFWRRKWNVTDNVVDARFHLPPTSSFQRIRASLLLREGFIQLLVQHVPIPVFRMMSYPTRFADWLLPPPVLVEVHRRNGSNDLKLLGIISTLREYPAAAAAVWWWSPSVCARERSFWVQPPHRGEKKKYQRNKNRIIQAGEWIWNGEKNVENLDLYRNLPLPLAV